MGSRSAIAYGYLPTNRPTWFAALRVLVTLQNGSSRYDNLAWEVVVAYPSSIHGRQFVLACLSTAVALSLAPLLSVTVQGVYRCKLIMLAIELTNDWLSAVCEVS
jgi:hypothetical protein